MSGKEHEKEVHVTTDARTLEQRHQDMVQNLERKQKHMSTAGRQRSASKRAARRDWLDEVDHWINESYRRWNDDMRRMQGDVFTLLPVTEFDLQPLVPFGAFGPLGHVPPILQRMERQLEALPGYLDYDRHDVAGPSFGSGTSGALMPYEANRGGILDFLKDAYEVGEDGKLHFKVRFNVHGFGPDDIKVTTAKNRLTVTGKKVSKTDTSSSSKEFSRTIYLPDSVDDSQFECHMTKDGVLMLEAPVRSPDYQALTFDNQRQLAIKPQPSQALQLKKTGVAGPQVLTDGSSKKLHVEVPVEPGFNPDDLLVRMDSNRVIISGRKYVTEGSGDAECTHLKEFTRSYMVPDTVDALSIKTQLVGDTLVVEAPMLR